jgi:hypothetical protein
MERQCLTQPHLDSSSTGLSGAEKRQNSRVRVKACEGQNHALSDDSAAAAGHTRHTKSHTQGGSPSRDRLPATGDVGEDASMRRTSKREGAPCGAASASPGGTSSRELRRGTSSSAASRSAAAPGPTPAPKPTRTAEASSPLSAASPHAQSAPFAVPERLLRAALGGSSFPAGEPRLRIAQPLPRVPKLAGSKSPIQPPLTIQAFDRSICRRRVRVWWSAEGKWFAGKVTTPDSVTLCNRG